MGFFIGCVVAIAAFAGVFLGVNEMDKNDDRDRCETIARTTQGDVRFIEINWGEWGCYAPQGDDWVNVESGKVIP